MAEVRVLMVCTGNICRSPTAEAVLRHKLRQAGLQDRVDVDSAGTSDYNAGDPPSPNAVSQARLRGYDLGGLQARQLRSSDFENFDLLLCMDHGHRERLALKCPENLRNRIRMFLEFSAAADGREEVPDPYNGDVADYDFALDLIEPGIDGLIEALKRDYL